MKKILVVGGTRYIGRRLVEQHIQDGDDVTLITRGITEDPFGKSVKRVHLDLMHEEDVLSKFPRKEYDIVYDTMVLCPDHIKQRLQLVECGKYVMVSTAGVYRDRHFDISEKEFDATKEKWSYCGYAGVAYDDRKRQAEAALVQDYSHVKSVRVRVPVIVGIDDYTQRLKWYVEHIVKKEPMAIDNMDVELPFSYVNEVSDLMYKAAKSGYVGAVNGALKGTIKIADIVTYIEERVGNKALLTREGEQSPYTEKYSYSLNTKIAEQIGCEFRDISVVREVIDYYINNVY